MCNALSTWHRSKGMRRYYITIEDLFYNLFIHSKPQLPSPLLQPEVCPTPCSWLHIGLDVLHSLHLLFPPLSWPHGTSALSQRLVYMQRENGLLSLGPWFQEGLPRPAPCVSTSKGGLIVGFLLSNGGKGTHDPKAQGLEFVNSWRGFQFQLTDRQQIRTSSRDSSHVYPRDHKNVECCTCVPC